MILIGTSLVICDHDIKIKRIKIIIIIMILIGTSLVICDHDIMIKRIKIIMMLDSTY
jgi:hypothetical protein